jgi:hypothetical protein
MSKLLALALAITVSFAGVTASVAKSKHHHHGRMSAKNVSSRGYAAPPAYQTPSEFGNNPTPTRNDPPGTRTQCRGGCN